MSSNITTLTGANEFMVHEHLAGSIDKFVKDHGDFAVERIDCDEASLGDIANRLDNSGLFSDNKLVVLSTPSANKLFVAQAVDMLANISPETEVLIIEPKLDKRSAYAKWLKKHTNYIDYTELNEQQLINWIISFSKKLGTTISSSDARYLMDRTGTNQMLLSHEIEKLSIASSGKTIDKDLIDEMVVSLPQSTTFELLDAAFAKNFSRANSLYMEQRSLKVEPQQLIAMIGWQLHVLALIKSAGERSQQQIASESHIHPFVIQKNYSLSKKITATELKRLIQRLQDLDVAMKSTSIDADEAMLAFFAEIAGKN